jgi:hypothetical protein
MDQHELLAMYDCVPFMNVLHYNSYSFPPAADAQYPQAWDAFSVESSLSVHFESIEIAR